MVTDWDRAPLETEALLCEVAGFEYRFGVHSSRLVDAFRLPDGDVLDNDDFRRWHFVYGVLQRQGVLR